MSDIDCLVGLLHLVKESGERIETRIKIQKEAFLLATKDVGWFSLSDFSYHHYGPYSRVVSDALQLAVSSGMLNEENEGDEDFVKYSYSLTDSARGILDNYGNCSDEFRRVVSICGDKHWRLLELAATAKYLALNEKEISFEESIRKALELKPKTSEYQKGAVELLQAL